MLPMLGLGPLLLCLLAVSPPCAAAPPRWRSGLRADSSRNKLLLVSFDGFRWDYDRDVDTPNLDKMALDGVKATYVTPPFLTITSPSHFTLLTGIRTQSYLVVKLVQPEVPYFDHVLHRF